MREDVTKVDTEQMLLELLFICFGESGIRDSMGISLLLLLWFLSVTLSIFINIFGDFDNLHRTGMLSVVF